MLKDCALLLMFVLFLLQEGLSSSWMWCWELFFLMFQHDYHWYFQTSSESFLLIAHRWWNCQPLCPALPTLMKTPLQLLHWLVCPLCRYSWFNWVQVGHGWWSHLVIAWPKWIESPTYLNFFYYITFYNLCFNFSNHQTIHTSCYAVPSPGIYR